MFQLNSISTDFLHFLLHILLEKCDCPVLFIYLFIFWIKCNCVIFCYPMQCNFVCYSNFQLKWTEMTSETNVIGLLWPLYYVMGWICLCSSVNSFYHDIYPLWCHLESTSNEHVSTTMNRHSMLFSLKSTLLILAEWYCNIICPCFIWFFPPTFSPESLSPDAKTPPAFIIQINEIRV